MKHESVKWAMVNEAGAFQADKCGVLLWPRRKDVPCSEGERPVRVRVTVVKEPR